MDAINTHDAAEIIGISESHVRYLLLRGKLKGRKFSSRAWAVDRESAREYAGIPQTLGRPRLRTQAISGNFQKSGN